MNIKDSAVCVSICVCVCELQDEINCSQPDPTKVAGRKGAGGTRGQ